MVDIHALAGAYVLDAVDDVERAAFARHLAECETCALEVAELRETTTRLVDATWSAPPPRLREQVMAQIHRTRQVGPGRPERESSSAMARWRRRTAIAVAAGFLAAGAGATTYVVQERQVQRERAVTASVQEVLAAPDVVVRSSEVQGGGRMTLLMSRSLDRGVVVVDATAPADDRAYQLWAVESGGPRDAGVLAAGSGSATTVIDGIAAANQVALTLEPAGGSAAPSLPPRAGISTA
jgi:hypothetical protein